MGYQPNNTATTTNMLPTHQYCYNYQHVTNPTILLQLPTRYQPNNTATTTNMLPTHHYCYNYQNATKPPILLQLPTWYQPTTTAATTKMQPNHQSCYNYRHVPNPVLRQQAPKCHCWCWLSGMLTGSADCGHVHIHQQRSIASTPLSLSPIRRARPSITEQHLCRARSIPEQPQAQPRFHRNHKYIQ